MQAPVACGRGVHLTQLVCLAIPWATSRQLSPTRTAQVQVVTTEHARHFFDMPLLDTNGEAVKVWQDADEWSAFKHLGDKVIHIEVCICLGALVLVQYLSLFS